jgi:predicted Zn-dependent protease
LADIHPGTRPALDTDEAGLWMQMARVEKSLRTSGQILTDTRLNEYVRKVVCNMAGPYCPDIRIYIVQTPYFNASMAPNGVMQVWTGLILRADNEAQFAYVLGHEIGHYLRRHSVQSWRNARSMTDILAFIQIAAAGAGFGSAGSLIGGLIAQGSILAFSRDNEREADDVGFELMATAGYDPREAPRIWEGLLKERAASKEGSPFIFFATHPPTDERVETLKTRAEQEVAGLRMPTVGKAQYMAAIQPFRSMFLRDELRRREFAETQVLLDRMKDAGIGLGELHFFQGELCRLRAEQGDEQQAIVAYQKAIESNDAPVETHRALGLMLSRTGERAKARLAFERYLQLKPDADDREMVRAYLKEGE